MTKGLSITVSDIVSIGRSQSANKKRLLCAVLALRHGQSGTVSLDNPVILPRTKAIMEALYGRLVDWNTTVREIANTPGVASVRGGIVHLKGWRRMRIDPYYDVDAKVSLGSRAHHRWTFHDYAFFTLTHALYARLRFIDKKAGMKMISYSLIRSEFEKALGTTISDSTIARKKRRGDEFGLYFIANHIVLTEEVCELLGYDPDKYLGLAGRWADFVAQAKDVKVVQGFLPDDATLMPDGSVFTAKEGWCAYDRVKLEGGLHADVSLLQRERHKHMYDLLEHGKPKEGRLLTYRRIIRKGHPALVFDQLTTLTRMKDGLKMAYADLKGILQREGQENVGHYTLLDILKCIATTSTDFARTVSLKAGHTPRRTPAPKVEKVRYYGMAAACDINVKHNKITQRITDREITNHLLNEIGVRVGLGRSVQSKLVGRSLFLFDKNGRITDTNWKTCLQQLQKLYGVARIYPTNVHRCVAMANGNSKIKVKPQLLWHADDIPDKEPKDDPRDALSEDDVLLMQDDRCDDFCFVCLQPADAVNGVCHHCRANLCVPHLVAPAVHCGSCQA